MDPFLSWSRRKQSAIIDLIRTFVECESPSDSPEAIDRFMTLLGDSVSDIASVQRSAAGAFVCHFRLPDKKKPGRQTTGRILALGHADTVWPLGTLSTMPFRSAKGRLWGPGVLDMKAGLVFFIFAMRALIELDIEVPHEVVLLVNPDEETGSKRSRAGTEKLAKQSKAVLVLEPGTGLEGKAKTARKGIGAWDLKVRGVASHAGVDFAKGASAVIELARQIERISGFTDLKRGITVNPGVIAGGTRSNVIASEASAEIDMRVPCLADAKAIERKFRALKPFDKRCTLELTGGLNRPPMERTKGTVALFRLARTLAADLGVDLEESSTGGGSDGNFTSALGIPTLDGIGAVGEGAHAAHESILIGRIPDRVALLAKLVREFAIS
ncbi:MAG TPA: M20 family metallopeptidase [Bryobacteraceae bacterium]|jgi:glutamate carboxypeptidase|nr:M20 family metallopeptidase [Bryobacteraceae bacterium]